MSSKLNVQKFCASHGFPFSDFLADFGDHESYATTAVLAWAGY